MARSPRNSVLSLDDATVIAAEILNEAVKDARAPGVNDFVIVTSALQRVIDGRRASDLAVAGAAFDQLDGDVRAEIAERAYDRANDAKLTASRVSPALPPIRSSPPRAPTREEKTVTKGAPLISAMAGVLRR